MLTLGLAFLAGLLTIFNPCVLPLACCNSLAARTVRSLSGGTPGIGFSSTTSPSSRSAMSMLSHRSMKRKSLSSR